MSIEKCPTCHKYWEENYRGGLYCPKCGQTKHDAIRRIEAGRVKVSKKTDSQESVIREIKSHPVYGWMWRLTEKMAADLGFNIEVTFRNSKGSKCVYGSCNPGETNFTIQYGYQCIDKTYEKGFYEYKSWRYVWDYESHQGKKGIWCLVLHEVAHAIQTNRTGRTYGIMHDTTWAQAVKNLQKQYPFESVVAA